MYKDPDKMSERELRREVKEWRRKMNVLKLGFDPQSRAGKLLCEEFGGKNVETALICIAHQCDPVGLRVCIQPTYEMVRDILEAAHGRLPLDGNRVCGDRLFYHHPDESPIGESVKK
jgi:hypothetical protein